MKKILNVILAALSILFTIIVQKLIFRIMALPYNNLLLYWGSFIAIFVVIFGVANIVITKKE